FIWGTTKQTFPSSEFFHLSEILANSVVGLYTGVSFTRETGKKTFYSVTKTTSLNLQDCLFQCVALQHCDTVEFKEGNKECTLGQKQGIWQEASYSSTEIWAMSRPTGCIPDECLKPSTRRLGNNFAVLLTASAYDCGCKCVTTRGCTDFSYRISLKQCYLKNIVTNPEIHNDHVSGVLNC
ncbi:uncharacterized protein LOC111716233, partial [Eurytemora carolleeae]|uniref:uncharacterized protein LOC111716233 n=1 Tax=Eurytemora carolleeae TaxID=1294199 RepID=UPI000C77BDC9